MRETREKLKITLKKGKHKIFLVCGVSAGFVLELKCQEEHYDRIVKTLEAFIGPV